MSTEKETTPEAKLAAPVTALVRAAAAFAYEVAQAIKDENGENARALAGVLTDDSAAEVIVSVRLAPTVGIVQSVVSLGRPYVIYKSGVVEIEGVRH